MTDIDSLNSPLPDSLPEDSLPPNTPIDSPENNVESANKIGNLLENGLQQITSIFENMNHVVGRLQADFETKIRYDESKEKTINALHRELQDYRDDLVLKHLRPLVNDLITLYDDIGAIANSYSQEQADVNNRLLNDVRGFQADIEEMLRRNGIEAFELDGDVFISPQQRVQKSVVTNDPALDTRISAKLRKGFSYGERVLRPQIVNIYRYTPPTNV